MISEASNKISGYDHKIMVEIANYVAENEPLNEYFDPVITRQKYDLEKNTYSQEEIETFESNFALGLNVQRAAFSKTFELMEKFLDENPKIDIKFLDQLYVEMAKLYGFNYDLNQTYLRFRDYLLESRESMKEIYDFFGGNATEIFKYLTRYKVQNPKDIEMKVGPFGFEFYIPQSILNQIDLPDSHKMSFFERLYDHLVPDTNLQGLSDYLVVRKNEEVVIVNSIFIPKENPYIDLFRDFRTYLKDRKSRKSLEKLGLQPKSTNVSPSSSRDHENNHALYNMILFSELKDKPRDVINEIARILKTSNPDAVKDEDFKKLCEYITRIAYYEHTTHELLSRIKDGNFIPSIDIIKNPKAYNFTSPESQLNTEDENSFIREILKVLLKTTNPIKAKNFENIYLTYVQNMKDEIQNVYFNIALILENFPDKKRELTYKLMFADFSKWREITHDYFYSLIKK